MTGSSHYPINSTVKIHAPQEPADWLAAKEAVERAMVWLRWFKSLQRGLTWYALPMKRQASLLKGKAKIEAILSGAEDFVDGNTCGGCGEYREGGGFHGVGCFRTWRKEQGPRV